MTLGTKIKSYRKSMNLSQLELETEIAASPGSVSRIEADKVHPTKETINRISQALQLNKEQIIKLFDIANNPVTEVEIQAAIATIQKHYDSPNTLSHLMDDRWNIRHFSNSFIKLMYFTEAEIKQMLGQNIMVLLFDPESPFFKRYDTEKMGIFLDYVLSRKREILLDPAREAWIDELIKQLEEFPRFKSSWEKIKKEPLEYFSNLSRTIFFEVNGKKFQTLYGREVIKEQPRFYVVEYALS